MDGIDGVIVEFLFQNEKSYPINVGVAFANFKASLSCIFLNPYILPFVIFCSPCIPKCVSVNKEVIRLNQIENLWRRRLALTKNGVVHKTLPAHIYGPDPKTPCSSCLFLYGRHPALIQGGSAKTIPLEKVQDVSIRKAIGESVVTICCCFPQSFPNIDDVVDIDTSGKGIELSVTGLINGEFLKKAIFALKNGRPLLPTEGEPGIVLGEADRSKFGSFSNHVKNPYPILHNVAPRSVEMSRVPREGATNDALIAAIEAQNNILRQHTVLLEKIASRA